MRFVSDTNKEKLFLLLTKKYTFKSNMDWGRIRLAHKCEFQRNVFDDYPMNPTKRCWLKFISIHSHNPRVAKFIRSSAALDFEKKRQIKSKWWFIIHPFSLFRTVWESVMIIVFTLEVLECPFFMTWRENLYFEYSSDILKIMCILNILVTFCTGYTDEINEEIVLHPGKIAVYYLKELVVFEILASFPWTSLFIRYVITEEMLAKNIKWNIFSWTAFFTIVYAIRMIEYSRNIIYYMSSSVRVYRFYRLIVAGAFTFHWLTCIECNSFVFTIQAEKSLFPKAHSPNKANISHEYAQCFFRCTALVTRLTYGNIISNQPEDLFPDLMCLTIGAIFFYVCLEECLLLDRSRTSPEAKYRVQIQLLGEFMRMKEMPKHLQERLLSLYEYRFQKMFFRESIILSTLSPRLRQEIAMHTCRHLVQESLLFRNVPRSVMAFIVSTLKHDIFLPNEVLIKAGSYGDCMFFLTTGTVAIITRAGTEIAHLRDGAFFGELALVLEDERRVTSVVAIEFCEVYRLERSDFQRVIRPHRDLFSQIQRVAFDRLRQTSAVEGAMRRTAGRPTPTYAKMFSK